jgi:hypothetical protein
LRFLVKKHFVALLLLLTSHSSGSRVVGAEERVADAAITARGGELAWGGLPAVAGAGELVADATVTVCVVYQPGEILLDAVVAGGGQFVSNLPAVPVKEHFADDLPV